MTIIAAKVRLVPFGEIQAKEQLAIGLSQIVHGSRRIALDFPAVPRRYGSVVEAIRSIWDNVVAEGPKFVAFAVLGNDHILGAASLTQAEIRGARGLFGRQPSIVQGPQLACWLMPREARPEGFRRYLLQDILSLLDTEVQQRQMTGTPWTLVRPGHYHSVEALLTTGAFDGFREQLRPARYWRVDRSWETRQLYVGRRVIKAKAEAN